ncbi:MAG TPA: DUF6790 family protein [Pseudolabrys sp.]|nr:DUF6790 family protein [Pseudolabrys sp.]
MRSIIGFALSNYSLSFLVLGFVAAGIALMRRNRSSVAETMFAYYLLCAIGFSFLYNFVMHVFFQETASKFIGWAPSPFETEVGTASLGFALVAFLAFKGSYGLRIGAVVGPSAFLLGAAVGHVYQMLTVHNFAPGNAGVVLYTDIGVPLIGFVLLALTRPTLPSPS